MKTLQTPASPWRLRRLLTAGSHACWALVTAAALNAQALPTVTPEDLAKYDANGNGALDPDELEAKRVAESGDTPVMLSPFEVVSEATGYFQSNTMSGTRLNSKIEDLGQSITVMTKEQMTDFAMIDINDVFDHMASTEGTHTYSDFAVDRTGAVTDNVALNPNNANRVRGIGSANIAFNNIPMTGRVPVDRLWIDSIELSRGPNANIFGLGNASGTVNQVPATANVTRDFSTVELRADSYGGWRVSLDTNRVLLDNKLAVRGSYAYQHTAFVRKPSGEDARRLSLQVKARPFDKTTFSLSWYGYNNAAQRPNFTTPRDNITGWIETGRPSWDPVTRLITVNGLTYGQGLVAGSTTPITSLPAYFNNSPSDGRSFIRIGGEGDEPYWTIPTVTNATTPAAGGVGNNIRYVSTSAVNSYGAAQPLFATYAALGDKSIYDWEEHSLLGGNKAWDDVDIYLAQLDQIFVSTLRHTLASRFAYLREDSERVENLPLGPASVNGVIGDLYVDPNTRTLDGAPNPYFGRPYLRSKEPYLRDRPVLWETVQAQAVYQLDLSHNEGWSKWLGTHRALGYYEYKDQKSWQFNFRRTATSRNLPWQIAQFDAGIPLATRSRGQNVYPSSHNHMRVYEFYYVGDTPAGGVEYAPNPFPNGASVPFVWGNTGNFRYDPVTIDWTPTSEAGGNANRQLIVKTQGAVLQSSFLNDRLVTTFGTREDTVLDRNGVLSVLTPDLLEFDRAVSNQWRDASTWRSASGKTKTTSVVVRPFRDLKFLNNRINGDNGVRKFLAEAVSSLSPSYNRSDNFIAQGPAFDLFMNRLPNQTGVTEEYGLWLNLFEGRVSLRYNRYNTEQINLRNGDISTIAQRVLRADGLNANDAWNLLDRATDWVTQLNPGFTPDQVRTQVAGIMGLTGDQITGLENAISTGSVAATQDAVSKGHELEVNVNMNRFWTISGSFTKTEAVNKNAGSTIEDWIKLRMPFWETVEDPRFTAADGPGLPTGANGHLLWRYIRGPQFTAFNYHGTNSAATNYVTFVEGPLAVYRQLEGRPRPQLSKYNVRFGTRYNLAGLSDNRILKSMTVGGSLRYIDKRAIGFFGVQSLPEKITALDTNRPIYSSGETQVDLFASYRTRMFGDRVRASFQLNVKNAQESGGGLRVTAAFPDGSPLAYRIIDPRQFILSASFDL